MACALVHDNNRGADGMRVAQRSSIFDDIQSSNLLESAFHDSPAFHKQLRSLADSVAEMFTTKEKILTLTQEFHDLQRQSSSVLKKIASLLNQPEFVDTEEVSGGDLITIHARTCSTGIVKIANCYQTISEKTIDFSIAQIDKLEKTTLASVENAKDKYLKAHAVAHDASMDFAKMSKKKSGDRERYDAGAALQKLRKRAHAASLSYATELLLAPKIEQTAILVPAEQLLRECFELSQNFTSAFDDTSTGMTSIETARNGALEFVQEQQRKLRVTFERKIPRMLAPIRDSQYHRNPDPLEANVATTDNTTWEPTKQKEAQQKAQQLQTSSTATKHGFLSCRKFPGLKHKSTDPWMRVFFAIYDFVLLVWHPTTNDWAIVSKLTGAHATMADVVDRFFTFKIVFPSKSVKRKSGLTLVLQAESRKDAVDWVKDLTEAARDLSGSLGLHANSEVCSEQQHSQRRRRQQRRRQ